MNAGRKSCAFSKQQRQMFGGLIDKQDLPTSCAHCTGKGGYASIFYEAFFLRPVLPDRVRLEGSFERKSRHTEERRTVAIGVAGVIAQPSVVAQNGTSEST